MANLDRYSLNSDFRKFDFLFVNGALYQETDLTNIHSQPYGYAVVDDSSEYIVNSPPTAASTAYTLSNSETAGSSVVIEVDTVSGLSAGTEIWVNDSTSSEFTLIQSVDSSAVTVTARLANNHSSGIKFYRVDNVNYFGYYKTITALTGTDTPVLPAATHLIIPHYAAYLYYRDLRNKEAADLHLDTWNRELADIWLQFDKRSTGYSNQITL